MYISRLAKLILNGCTILSMVIGGVGTIGVLMGLALLRLPSSDHLVDVSGCMVAAGMSGLATLGVMDLLTQARR